MMNCYNNHRHYFTHKKSSCSYTSKQEVGGAKLTYHTAYIQYLVEYHVTRDWFECHEIMEECWKEEQDPQLKPTWHMLVKIAVAQYHERRGNYNGAAKLYRGVLELWAHVKWDVLSIDATHLQQEVIRHLSHVEQQIHGGQSVSFEAINMCLIDNELLYACERYCERHSMTWQILNTPVGDDIIHRHRLRDRSDVITARNKALALKRSSI